MLGTERGFGGEQYARTVIKASAGQSNLLPESTNASPAHPSPSVSASPLHPHCLQRLSHPPVLLSRSVSVESERVS